MYDLLISLLVFVLIFGGALAGMVVRPLLSEHHQTPDSRDVKMATGLIGTLTALVLGLLIASAKSSFDQKTNQVRQMTATVILLDDLLMQYGPEATPVRRLLRQSIPPLANRIWREEEVPNGKLVQFESSAPSRPSKTNWNACFCRTPFRADRFSNFHLSIGDRPSSRTRRHVGG
jgi:hypothetical protein